MSGLDYETVSRFTQQAGTLYFVLIFAVAVGWVLWPKNKKGFEEASQIPFNDVPLNDEEL